LLTGRTLVLKQIVLITWVKNLKPKTKKLKETKMVDNRWIVINPLVV
jgi:hypothetical protein